MHNSIYLSPSTQENNIGVGLFGTEEKRMNEVCDILQKHLLRHGITVFRNKPEMTLSQVVTDSNSKNPAIHFAIHSNANQGKSRGCEVYCHRFGGEGERLARLIYDKLEPLTPSADRGVKESLNHFGVGKPLYELAYTRVPAALVEIAFHDNPDDATWILANIEPIGLALAKGILEYFGIVFVQENPPLKQIFKVQVGSFTDRKNAETLQKKLKLAGFDAIIQTTA